MIIYPDYSFRNLYIMFIQYFFYHGFFKSKDKGRILLSYVGTEDAVNNIYIYIYVEHCI